MTAKEYLSRVYRLDHKIYLMKLEVEEYNRLANSPPGQDFTRPRVDHTPSNEAYFVKWVNKAIDKEAEIKKEIEKLEQIKVEVSNAIDVLDNIEYRMILKYRYINSMQFPDIASKLYMSESTLKRKHKEALENFVVPC